MTLLNNLKENMQKMIIALILVALASQINLELFESDFVVSAGVVLFVIFLFYYEKFIPIIFGTLSGLAIFGLRIGVQHILGNGESVIIESYMPEIVFYVIYSVFFMLFLENDRKNNLGYVFIVLIICDFASNLLEVFVRYVTFEDIAILEFIPTLIFVSFIRSSIVWVALTALHYYNMMLDNKEQQERYKRLLLLISKLETEVYWIENNIINIKKTVAHSYELHDKIINDKDRDTWADMSLSIAKNVNEIKKDNELVIKGIKDITEKELKNKGMKYKEINDILSETMIKECKTCDKDIDFEFVMGEDFYTINNYYLMTVLRNLIINSIDAVRNAQEDGKIRLVHESNVENHVFTVWDNGCGIRKEFLSEIFSPSFSTKVNNQTGEVCRGLGLSIVKYIVENHLKGNVEVASDLGSGTTFVISIPRESLEEQECEVVEVK